jgi:hypothetical protein
MKILTERPMKEVDKYLQKISSVSEETDLQSISQELVDTDTALRGPKGKIYALFIDYNKAFNLMNRKILVKKLDEATRQDNSQTYANTLAAYVVELFVWQVNLPSRIVHNTLVIDISEQIGHNIQNAPGTPAKLTAI